MKPTSHNKNLSKKEIKKKNKEKLKMIRRCKGRGVAPIPPTKIVPDKKKKKLNKISEDEVENLENSPHSDPRFIEKYMSQPFYGDDY